MNSTASSTPAPPSQEDNLADDLMGLLSSSGLDRKQRQSVLDKLVPYVVARDHRILTHSRQSSQNWYDKFVHELKGFYTELDIPQQEAALEAAKRAAGLITRV